MTSTIDIYIPDAVAEEAHALSHRICEEESNRSLAARIEASKVRSQNFHLALEREQDTIWRMIKMKNVILPAMIARVSQLKQEEEEFCNLVIHLAHY